MTLTKYEEISIPSKEEEAKVVETLRFLLVSDIHLAYSQVDKLVAWHWYHSDKTLKYDFILGSGDFGNINHEVLPEDLKAESALEVV